MSIYFQILLVASSMALMLFANAAFTATDNEDDIPTLVKKIGVDPDPAHADYTPAVFKLISLGRPAIKPCLELMSSEDVLTRMRAHRVISSITMKEHGFARGQGWATENGERVWKDFWNKMGSLDWKKDHKENKDSIELWIKWLESEQK